jgi:hypothetical protein
VLTNVIPGEVFRQQSVSARRVVITWGRALRASPASTAQFQFRRNVESFLVQRGRSIWGATFLATAGITTFQRGAEIRKGSPTAELALHFFKRCRGTAPHFLGAFDGPRVSSRALGR